MKDISRVFQRCRWLSVSLLAFLVTTTASDAFAGIPELGFAPSTSFTLIANPDFGEEVGGFTFKISDNFDFDAQDRVVGSPAPLVFSRGDATRLFDCADSSKRETERTTRFDRLGVRLCDLLSAKSRPENSVVAVSISTDIISISGVPGQDEGVNKLSCFESKIDRDLAVCGRTHWGLQIVIVFSGLNLPETDEVLEELDELSIAFFSGPEGHRSGSLSDRRPGHEASSAAVMFAASQGYRVEVDEIEDVFMTQRKLLSSEPVTAVWLSEKPKYGLEFGLLFLGSESQAVSRAEGQITLRFENPETLRSEVYNTIFGGYGLTAVPEGFELVSADALSNFRRYERQMGSSTENPGLGDILFLPADNEMNLLPVVCHRHVPGKENADEICSTQIEYDGVVGFAKFPLSKVQYIETLTSEMRSIISGLKF